MIEVPLLAGPFLGDTLLPRQWIAIFVTLIGIALSQRRETRQIHNEPPRRQGREERQEIS